METVNVHTKTIIMWECPNCKEKMLQTGYINEGEIVICEECGFTYKAVL